ncbi:MAG: hypothetical protein ACRDSP_12160 [Pseudonocardiaceae bacterium]
MVGRQLIPPPAEPPLQVVLTCGNADCQHTFEPDLHDFATAQLACPRCGGWAFRAELAEPTTPALGGDR